MRQNFLRAILLQAAILPFFSFNFLIAQEVVQPITCVFGTSVESYSPETILCDSSNTIFLTKTGTFNSIERVNPDLSAASKALVSLDIPGEKQHKAFTYRIFNEKLYAFAAIFLKDDIGKIYASEIDKENFNVIGKISCVFEYSTSLVEKPEETDFMVETRYPKIQTSEMGNQLLIFKMEGSGGKNADEIHAKVFDGAFDSYWEKHITAPLGSNLFAIEDLLIFDDGTLLICGYDTYNKEFSKIAKKNGKADYMYHIITIADHSETIVDRKVDPAEVFISSLKIGMKQDGGIVGAGFYSDDDDDLLNGVFFVNYPAKDKNQSVFKTTEFTEDFLLADLPESELSSPNNNLHGLKNYQLKQFFVKNDGSVTLSAEHIFTKSKASNPFTCYYDIMITSFDFSGVVLWQKRIYKKHENKNGMEIPLFSFFICPYNDQLLVFYNDDVDNPVSANSQTLDPYTAEKKSRLMCVTVNSDGELNKQIVFTADKNSPTPIPILLTQTGKSKYVLYAAFRTLNAPSAVYSIKIGQ